MSYSSAVLADGAVGFWKLGEALTSSPAVDATGTQNGAYTNSPSGGVAGIAGGSGATAVTFHSASSDFCGITDNAAQHVGDVFSIEAWVKLASTGITQNIFCSGNNGAAQLVLSTTGNILAQKTNTSNISTATVAITDTTTFHHCVWTKNGAANKIWLDSADVTGSITNATLPNNSSGWLIAIGPGSTNPANATMQFVALYPAALTSGQVSNHYSLGSAAAPVVGNTAYDPSTLWTLLG